MVNATIIMYVQGEEIRKVMKEFLGGRFSLANKSRRENPTTLIT